MWFPPSSVWEQGPLGNEFCRLENNNKKRFRLVALERGNRIQSYAETACHVHEVDWGRKIISLLFSSTGSHLFSCGLSSSLWLTISTFFSVSEHAAKQHEFHMGIAIFLWVYGAEFLVTKRYNSLRETWLKMETTMALISNVGYTDGQQQRRNMVTAYCCDIVQYFWQRATWFSVFPSENERL